MWTLYSPYFMFSIFFIRKLWENITLGDNNMVAILRYCNIWSYGEIITIKIMLLCDCRSKGVYIITINSQSYNKIL